MEDNNVYVNIKINTNDIKYGTKEVSEAVAKAAQDMSRYGRVAQAQANSAANAFLKQNQAVANATAEVDRLSAKLEELKSTKVKTSYLTDEEDALKTLEAEYSKLENKKLAMENAGKQDSAKYQDTLTEMRMITHEIETQKNLLASLQNDPRSYTNADTSAVEQQLESAMQRQSSAVNGASLAYEKFNNTLAKNKHHTLGIVSALKKATLFTRKFKTGNLDLGKVMKKGLTTILKYGFGIRSLYLAFRKLRSAMIDGFKTLAKENPEFNKSLSGIATELGALKNSFAAAFAPLVQIVAPIIESTIAKLNTLMRTFSSVIATLTGKNTFLAAKKNQIDFAKSLDSAGSSASKAEKKNKKYMSSLDEIATFTPKDKDDGGGGAAPSFETLEVSDKAKELADKLKGYWDKLKDMWKNADFTELGAYIGQKLKDALDKIPWADIQENGRKVGKSFATLLNGFFEVPDLGKTIGHSIAEALNTLVYTIQAFVENFHFASAGKFFADIVNSFFADTDWAAMGKTISELVSGILDLFIESVADTDWAQIGESIMEFIQNIDWLRLLVEIGVLIGSLLTGALQLLWGLVAKAFDGIAELFSTLGFDSIAGFFKGMADNLRESASKLKEWFKTKVVDPVKEFLGIHSPSTVFADIGRNLILGLFNGIKGKIDTVITLFKTAWENIKTNTINTWNAIKSSVLSIFNNMWSGIKGVINSILGGVQSMVNGIINGFNRAINAMNNLRFNVPDWVPYVGGKSLGFSIPTMNTVSIPMLASGAVIPPNAPFLATLGDQKHGNNFEAPEGLLRQVVREEAGGNGSYQFTATLNRRVLFDEFISEAKLRQASSGINPLLSL